MDEERKLVYMDEFKDGRGYKQHDGPSKTILDAKPLARPVAITGEVLLSSEEFTSLCPITKQPDFATISINYVPNMHILETKSLKHYLFSYRNYEGYAERIALQILEDIWDVVKPLAIRLSMQFRPRGGIPITIQFVRESRRG